MVRSIYLVSTAVAALSLSACAASKGDSTEAFGAQTACQDAVKSHVPNGSDVTFGSERRASNGGSTYTVTGVASWTVLGATHSRPWSCVATKNADWTVTARFTD